MMEAVAAMTSSEIHFPYDWLMQGRPARAARRRLIEAVLARGA